MTPTNIPSAEMLASQAVELPPLREADEDGVFMGEHAGLTHDVAARLEDYVMSRVETALWNVAKIQSAGGVRMSKPRLKALSAAIAQDRAARAQGAGEAVARDWELTCDECAGTGKVDHSEPLHVDGRYMGDDLTRVCCDHCGGYGFTVCIADIPKEIQQ